MKRLQIVTSWDSLVHRGSWWFKIGQKWLIFEPLFLQIFNKLYIFHQFVLKNGTFCTDF